MKKTLENGENTGKVDEKILEKFMKKYWKNAKKTGKVREIRQSKKVGTMYLYIYFRSLRREENSYK